MKNLIYPGAALLLLISMLVYSCQKEASADIASADLSQPHSIAVHLTDHPTPVFDSVFIDIRQLEVKIGDDSTQNGGWVSLNIRPGIYNILRFRNGLDTLFATGSLPNAKLKKIRLTLGDQNSVMKDGLSTLLKIKDEDRQVVAELQSANFDISNGQVLFWIDFDAGQSIQVDNSGSGSNNGYRLKSHISIFAPGNSGRIEGKVFPHAADAIVMAIKGTDTVTAIPENSGEFKMAGLAPGVYKVIFDGQHNYINTTINNITVRAREDAHLPSITLHL